MCDFFSKYVANHDAFRDYSFEEMERSIVSYFSEPSPSRRTRTFDAKALQENEKCSENITSNDESTGDTASAASSADDYDEDDTRSVISTVTSMVTVMPAWHGDLRMIERGILVRKLQIVRKHGTRERADPSKGRGYWKYRYNGLVYITDKESRHVIPCWQDS
jgi:hypothetical protein